MKILVVGSGGREHALCWGIAKSPLCDGLYCAPGNAGIAAVAECLPIAADDKTGLIAACEKYEIDFVVIGPDAQLEQGLADAVRELELPCFGPNRDAAEIEWSKGFMKDLCARQGVPTAAYQRFTDVDAACAYVREKNKESGGAPIVVKADGLAAGKGVTVARTVNEALAAIDAAMTGHAFGDAGNAVVIEEFMEGEEVSFFVLCDGETAQFFTTAQDHKAVGDGDKGPNTGGMGAYSPSPIVGEALRIQIMNEIILPTLDGLREMGRPFSGILYAGLMMTKSGPRVIEFNARFGDPETQVMVPRLKSDLLALLYGCAKGMLDVIDIEWYDVAALTVVMATKGYPGSYGKGSVIKGLDRADAVDDAMVFHAGTKAEPDGTLTANGGRVLCITAIGANVAEAQQRAYQAVDLIDWPEGFCRRDIGWRAIGK
ncbi:MAG: phosphoribosylamine--glycine ligase [Alphaproteobacteria bacterium]|nr:phosphoribosylamine--glycine ligase [Alphaproteobacteria bacterium]